MIVNLAIIAIIWFGGLQVDSGRLTQGEITALVSYMTQIMLALIVIANLVVIFTKASACGTRVSEVLELAPTVTDPGGEPVSIQAKEDTPKVSFQNVSFSYGGAQEMRWNRLNCMSAWGDGWRHWRHRLRQIHAGQSDSPFL